MKSFLLVLFLALSTPLAEAAPPETAEVAPVHEVELLVDGGYAPNRIEVPAGVPVRITITRRDYTPCTAEIVFPHLDLRVALPTNEPVVVDLPAAPPGGYVFHCGMNMLRGLIVAAPPVE